MLVFVLEVLAYPFFFALSISSRYLGASCRVPVDTVGATRAEH
jgi:hypothetical protein